MIITLGAEVAGVIRGVTSASERKALLGPTPSPVRFGVLEVATVHLAHPGIVMRKGDDDRNPWPRRHADEHVPKLRDAMIADGIVTR